MACGGLDISDSYATHHVSSLCQSLEQCFCGLLCQELISSMSSPFSLLDRVVDDLNPMLNFTRKEVENLLHFVEKEPAPQTSLNIKGIKEPVLQLACLKYPHLITKVGPWCTCPSTALSAEGGLSGSFIQNFILCRLIQLVLFLAPDSSPPLSPSPILSLSHPSSVSSAMRITWPW